DLEKALRLLSLPRPVGPHPDDGVMIEAGIGRYGPYVKHDRKSANLPDVDEVFTIGMNRAVEVLAAKQTRGRAAAAEPLKELGDHPEGGAIQVMNGRYGPYVKWEKVNATLPREVAPEDITMEQALELILAKAAKKGTKKASAGKSPARKSATKTAKTAKTAKKAAVKKPAVGRKSAE
ncbi:MAG: topoisomerase C-terminal repeat-containing protein, partial [Paracoccus sp. (in: a-proteobacteria)]